MNTRAMSFDVRQWLFQFENIVLKACETTANDRRSLLEDMFILMPEEFLGEQPPDTTANKKEIHAFRKRLSKLRLMNIATPALFEVTNMDRAINKHEILEPIIGFGLLLADALDENIECSALFHAFLTALFRAFNALGLKKVDIKRSSLLQEFGFGEDIDTSQSGGPNPMLEEGSGSTEEGSLPA